MAAKFEFEEQKDVSSARVLLQQGLRANPCSKHLWLEVGEGRGREGGRKEERKDDGKNWEMSMSLC